MRLLFMIYSYLLLVLSFQRKFNLEIFKFFLQSTITKSLLLPKASIFYNKAILEILHKIIEIPLFYYL